MIDPNIKRKADDIRTKVFGSEVRESLASGLEAISEVVVQNTGRQKNVEDQFQDVLDETTNKDFNSAPEIRAARNGKPNLKTRIDDFENQTTAQLDQKASKIELNEKLGNISAGTPLFAQGIANMTEPDRIYLNLEDYYLYIHDGSSFVSTGVAYLSNTIEEYLYFEGQELV